MALSYKNGGLQNSDTSIIQKHNFTYGKSPFGLGGVVCKVKSKMIYSTWRIFLNRIKKEMLFTY